MCNHRSVFGPKALLVSQLNKLEFVEQKIHIIYANAISIVVIKLPAPCNRILGMIEPLNSF